MNNMRCAAKVNSLIFVVILLAGSAIAQSQSNSDMTATASDKSSEDVEGHVTSESAGYLPGEYEALSLGMSQQRLMALRGKHMLPLMESRESAPGDYPKVLIEKYDGGDEKRTVLYGFSDIRPVLEYVIFLDEPTTSGESNALQEALRAALANWGLPDSFHAEKQRGTEYLLVLWVINDSVKVTISYIPPQLWKEGRSYPIATRYFLSSLKFEDIARLVSEPESFLIEEERKKLLGDMLRWKLQ